MEKKRKEKRKQWCGVHLFKQFISLQLDFVNHFIPGKKPTKTQSVTEYKRIRKTERLLKSKNNKGIKKRIDSD